MSVDLLALLTQGLISVVVAAPVGPVHQPRPQSDLSLTVSPSRMTVPADQLTRARQFTVTNGGSAAVDVVARAASFAAGPDGAPLLRADAPHSAAGWVTLRPDHLRLEGGAAQPVTMDIAVPANAEPGEHQLAVVFSVPARSGQAGIGVTGAVGAPVYISVPGAAVDSGDIIGPVRLIGVAGIVTSGLLLWLFYRRFRRSRAPKSPPAVEVQAGQSTVGHLEPDGRPVATQGAP